MIQNVTERYLFFSQRKGATCSKKDLGTFDGFQVIEVIGLPLLKLK